MADKKGRCDHLWSAFSSFFVVLALGFEEVFVLALRNPVRFAFGSEDRINPARESVMRHSSTRMFSRSSLLSATPTPPCAHYSTCLDRHVNWDARPIQPNRLQALPIFITLKLGASALNHAPQTTDANGFFTVTVGGLAASTYNWQVKGPIFLANSGIIEQKEEPSVSTEMGLMRVGDADNNGVDVSDFGILKQTFGKSVGDRGYGGRADFTGARR